MRMDAGGDAGGGAGDEEAGSGSRVRSLGSGVWGQGSRAGARCGVRGSVSMSRSWSASGSGARVGSASASTYDLEAGDGSAGDTAGRGSVRGLEQVDTVALHPAVRVNNQVAVVLQKQRPAHGLGVPCMHRVVERVICRGEVPRVGSESKQSCTHGSAGPAWLQVRCWGSLLGFDTGARTDTVAWQQRVAI